MSHGTPPTSPSQFQIYKYVRFPRLYPRILVGAGTECCPNPLFLCDVDVTCHLQFICGGPEVAAQVLGGVGGGRWPRDCPLPAQSSACVPPGTAFYRFLWRPPRCRRRELCTGRRDTVALTTHRARKETSRRMVEDDWIGVTLGTVWDRVGPRTKYFSSQ